MKGFRVILLMLAVTVPLASAANASLATPRIERREARQQMRIAQGMRSGELTRREALRLERGAARIDRMEWRARADGRVTACERAQLHRALNHESRGIHRLKHNQRER